MIVNVLLQVLQCISLATCSNVVFIKEYELCVWIILCDTVQKWYPMEGCYTSVTRYVMASKVMSRHLVLLLYKDLTTPSYFQGVSVHADDTMSVVSVLVFVSFGQVYAYTRVSYMK